MYTLTDTTNLAHIEKLLKTKHLLSVVREQNIKAQASISKLVLPMLVKMTRDVSQVSHDHR